MPRNRMARRSSIRVWITGIVIAFCAAVTPTAIAFAADTIWFDGQTYDGANQYSAVKYYLDGGRAAIVDSAFHTPRARTLSSSGAVLYSATGGFGGAVNLSHARALNAKASCNYLPYGGAPYSNGYLICKYTT